METCVVSITTSSTPGGQCSHVSKTSFNINFIWLCGQNLQIVAPPQQASYEITPAVFDHLYRYYSARSPAEAAHLSDTYLSCFRSVTIHLAVYSHFQSLPWLWDKQLQRLARCSVLLNFQTNTAIHRFPWLSERRTASLSKIYMGGLTVSGCPWT